MESAMRKLIWIICALAFPGAAYAEAVSTSTPCETQARSTCAPAASARLTSANGTVLLSRGTGFAEVKAGASLVAGDRLLVKQGSADLAFGPSCRTPLGPNSMVTLVEKDGVLCAARLSSDPNVVAADLPSRRAPPPPLQPVVTGPVFNPAWLLLPAAAGIGIAAFLLTRDDDNDFVFIPQSQPASP
jgi:hypothetical protein